MIDDVEPSSGNDPASVGTPTNRHYFRGENAIFQPSRRTFEQPGGFSRGLFEGLTPRKPFVESDTRVVAFGSCFARNIAIYLDNIGFNITNTRDQKAYVSRLGDGMVNTYSILQQFKWALDGWTPKVQTWHGANGKKYIADDDIQRRTEELFSNADLFIITLGLSEVWYDEPTGEVFWSGVPADKYDARRHKFRTIRQSENRDNINSIIDTIKRHRPDAAIVFTVSPIPLKATFRPIACMVANAASKASIKSALDEALQDRPAADNVYYFPAYEIVTLGFSNPFTEDMRHPWMHVINIAMMMFERYYCNTNRPDEEIEQAIADARALDLALAARDLGAEERAIAYGEAYRSRIRDRPLSDAREQRREARRQARRANAV